MKKFFVRKNSKKMDAKNKDPPCLTKDVVNTQVSQSQDIEQNSNGQCEFVCDNEPTHMRNVVVDYKTCDTRSKGCSKTSHSQPQNGNVTRDSGTCENGQTNASGHNTDVVDIDVHYNVTNSQENQVDYTSLRKLVTDIKQSEAGHGKDKEAYTKSDKEQNEVYRKEQDIKCSEDIGKENFVNMDTHLKDRKSPSNQIEMDSINKMISSSSNRKGAHPHGESYNSVCSKYDISNESGDAETCLILKELEKLFLQDSKADGGLQMPDGQDEYKLTINKKHDSVYLKYYEKATPSVNSDKKLLKLEKSVCLTRNQGDKLLSSTRTRQKSQSLKDKIDATATSQTSTFKQLSNGQSYRNNMNSKYNNSITGQSGNHFSHEHQCDISEYRPCNYNATRHSMHNKYEQDSFTNTERRKRREAYNYRSASFDESPRNVSSATCMSDEIVSRGCHRSRHRCKDNGVPLNERNTYHRSSSATRRVLPNMIYGDHLNGGLRQQKNRVNSLPTISHNDSNFRIEREMLDVDINRSRRRRHSVQSLPASNITDAIIPDSIMVIPKGMKVKPINNSGNKLLLISNNDVISVEQHYEYIDQNYRERNCNIPVYNNDVSNKKQSHCSAGRSQSSHCFAGRSQSRRSSTSSSDTSSGMFSINPQTINYRSESWKSSESQCSSRRRRSSLATLPTFQSLDENSTPRVVFIGDQFVGKTSLINRFTNGLFRSETCKASVIKRTNYVYNATIDIKQSEAGHGKDKEAYTKSDKEQNEVYRKEQDIKCSEDIGKENFVNMDTHLKDRKSPSNQIEMDSINKMISSSSNRKGAHPHGESYNSVCSKYDISNESGDAETCLILKELEKLFLQDSKADGGLQMPDGQDEYKLTINKKHDSVYLKYYEKATPSVNSDKKLLKLEKSVCLTRNQGDKLLSSTRTRQKSQSLKDKIDATATSQTSTFKQLSNGQSYRNNMNSKYNNSITGQSGNHFSHEHQCDISEYRPCNYNATRHSMHNKYEQDSFTNTERRKRREAYNYRSASFDESPRNVSSATCMSDEIVSRGCHRSRHRCKDNGVPLNERNTYHRSSSATRRVLPNMIYGDHLNGGLRQQKNRVNSLPTISHNDSNFRIEREMLDVDINRSRRRRHSVQSLPASNITDAIIPDSIMVIPKGMKVKPINNSGNKLLLISNNDVISVEQHYEYIDQNYRERNCNIPVYNNDVSNKKQSHCSAGRSQSSHCFAGRSQSRRSSTSSSDTSSGMFSINPQTINYRSESWKSSESQCSSRRRRSSLATLPTFQSLDENSTPRVVFIGDQFVGKTSLINRFTNGLFRSETCKASVIKRTNYVYNATIDKDVKIQFWDVDGGEPRKAIDCCQRAHAAVVIYDITNRTSFQMAEKYLEIVNPRASSVLIGNKLDLKSARKVSYSEGRLLAKIHRVEYIETSVKENFNVDMALQLVLASIPGEYICQRIPKLQRRSLSDPASLVKKSSSVNNFCELQRSQKSTEIEI